jgi:CubicO group peptidase (beta-lactamase class C family)
MGRRKSRAVRPTCVLPAAAIAAASLALAGCMDGGEEDPTGGPPAAGTQPSDPAVERVLDRMWPGGAGGTVVVARGDALVHCRGLGFADREAGTRASCDTAYDVMSMTKQFTAAAILKLEMLGELRVSDPIGEFFPSAPPDKREITLHELLTHTSGLPDALGDDYEPLSRAELVRGAFDARLRARPGSEYRYSNLGYSLLAAVVERASGTGYERFLATQLFEPAGMNDTGYVLPDWEADQVAVEYDDDARPQGRPFDHPWAADGPYWNLRGNGGLLSTARDMYRWHLALDRGTVLDRATTAKLVEPYVREGPGADSFYGYGWVVQRGEHGRFAWHDGGNGWSLGLIARVARPDVMVFWISNAAYRDPGWDLGRAEATLTRALIDAALADRA